MADAAMTYRLTVKEIAMMHGVYATFMPKPVFGENGSRYAHPPERCSRARRTCSSTSKDEYGLSKEGKSYIAGLLKHAPEIYLHHRPVGQQLQAPGARL